MLGVEVTGRIKTVISEFEIAGADRYLYTIPVAICYWYARRTRVENERRSQKDRIQ
ncbi:MAG: hypothetical protein GW874_07580 [Solirubrobacter sp.]|uniref:hypothetical protein n=1 Tax=Candidatus Aquicultor secundus TaxID=1973895 RepID=UPI002579F2ED|nr:hypothetical protein [Candidatus Aquicultor secundus]NCO66445.1 hypothetical protein [Solirubrobacter sp.]